MTPDRTYLKACAKQYSSQEEFEELQRIACKESGIAYLFAHDVEGADVDYCQEHACKDPYYAYFFASNIKGANIEYCKQAIRANIRLVYGYEHDFFLDIVKFVYDTIEEQEDAILNKELFTV